MAATGATATVLAMGATGATLPIGCPAVTTDVGATMLTISRVGPLQLREVSSGGIVAGIEALSLAVGTFFGMLPTP